MAKTAIITGGSRGIGKGVAQALASMNFQLALVARDSERLNDVAAQLVADYNCPKPLVCALDMTDIKSVQTKMAGLCEELGRVDVLVNSAGIFKGETSNISMQDLQEMVDVNLYALIQTIQAVLPTMRSQKEGYIFNIASYAGKRGMSLGGGYSASKFGVVGYSESLSMELAPEGIKVTSLCPGWVATDMAWMANKPFEEMIQPEDIAKTIQFLLSTTKNCVIREIVLECRV